MVGILIGAALIADARGRRRCRSLFRAMVRGVEGIRMRADDYLDRGDWVVMPFVSCGRRRGSASEVSLAETWGFEVRDKLIVEVREFLSTDEALKAVGLEE